MTEDELHEDCSKLKDNGRFTSSDPRGRPTKYVDLDGYTTKERRELWSMGIRDRFPNPFLDNPVVRMAAEMAEKRRRENGETSTATAVAA